MTTQDLQNTKNINMQVLSYDEEITHLGSHFSIIRPLKVLMRQMQHTLCSMDPHLLKTPRQYDFFKDPIYCIYTIYITPLSVYITNNILLLHVYKVILLFNLCRI